DVFLDVADGHGTEAVIQRTRTFAQTVLRANATADFWQRVGLMTQLSGLNDVAFHHQLEPVRDVVMDRTFPFAVRVATFEATIRLHLSFLSFERIIDLHEFLL